MDNFKDVPKSLSEVRSERSGQSADWTPRDMLIFLLREIDSGRLSLTTAAIAYTTTEDEISCLSAAPTRTATVGLFAAGTHMILED